jgi:hypothetical protein
MPACSVREWRLDSFLLGEGFHVQVDEDVWSTEKCIPVLEENKKQEEEEGEGEMLDLS